MRGFITNIEKETLENTNFRKVLYTSKFSQLVVMSIPVGESIGEETHDLDQFLRIEQGTAKVVLNGEEKVVTDGFSIVIPEGVKHNVINTGDVELKLYSIYSPPEHMDKIIRKTKQDAKENEEHFDGVVTQPS